MTKRKMGKKQELKDRAVGRPINNSMQTESWRGVAIAPRKEAQLTTRAIIEKD